MALFTEFFWGNSSKITLDKRESACIETIKSSSKFIFMKKKIFPGKFDQSGTKKKLLPGFDVKNWFSQKIQKVLSQSAQIKKNFWKKE